VREVNSAPVVTPIADAGMDELSTMTFTATATDLRSSRERGHLLPAGQRGRRLDHAGRRLLLDPGRDTERALPVHDRRDGQRLAPHAGDG
jgi:hypothetical protein